MCELFALSSNRVVGVRFTWRGFLRRGKSNRDGWGVAFYNDKAAIVVKEPLPAPDSSMARILRDTDYVRGKIVVSHVRMGTEGGKTYANTHPFSRELNGRDWVFAHNGDVSPIKGLDEFRLECYSPIGQTDSEHAFCYIMDRLRELGGKGLRNPYTVRDTLQEAAERIGRYGAFNFLLSDGKHLYAHANMHRRLHYLFRHPPHLRSVRLMDEDFEVNLARMKEPDEKAALVATTPLTRGEKWHPLPQGKVVVFKDGEALSVELLGKKEKEALAFIRSQPHRVSTRQVADSLNMPVDEAKKVVRSLLLKGWIKQDARDRVPEDHPNATFYTKKERREEISRKLEHLTEQFRTSTPT